MHTLYTQNHALATNRGIENCVQRINTKHFRQELFCLLTPRWWVLVTHSSTIKTYYDMLATNHKTDILDMRQMFYCYNIFQSLYIRFILIENKLYLKFSFP